jgi:LPS-assembly lipoprotein
MLSFKKIIYASLFFISACGFNPVYTDSNSSKLLGQITIQEPNTQNDFIFYSRLIDRFGDRGDRYTLSYAISTSEEDRALNFDGTAHRVEIFSSVSFSLKDKEKEIELLYDKEEMYLSYSNSGSTAAVLNAERETNKQLVLLLADKVADRISLTIVEENL